MIRKSFLKPLEKKVEGENVFMGNKYAYCSYHQRRGHVTNSCKTLGEDILDMISQGKYEIDENDSNQDRALNAISMDEEIYTTLRRGNPRSNPH